MQSYSAHVQADLLRSMHAASLLPAYSLGTPIEQVHLCIVWHSWGVSFSTEWPFGLAMHGCTAVLATDCLVLQDWS